MAWYSYRFASVIPGNSVQPGGASIKVLLTSQANNDNFVLAPSRKGYLLMELTRICEASTTGKQLYLLQDACLLNGDEILEGIRALEAFIGEIMSNPTVVLEATKEKHQLTTTIHSAGFKPLEARVVYSNEGCINDGFYYPYTEKKILDLMDESYASNHPCTSDDGDQLSDVFNFLKSHLELLNFASKSGNTIAYAEMAD